MAFNNTKLLKELNIWANILHLKFNKNTEKFILKFLLTKYNGTIKDVFWQIETKNNTLVTML